MFLDPAPAASSSSPAIPFLPAPGPAGSPTWWYYVVGAAALIIFVGNAFPNTRAGRVCRGILFDVWTIMGRTPPSPAPPADPPPKPPTVPPLPLLLLCLALAACGTPARTARDVARGGVLVVVHALDDADAACAEIALRAKGSKDEAKLTKAIALADTCAKAKTKALAWAKVAEAGIAAWEAGGAPNVGCAGARILEALAELAGAVEAAGGKLSPLVEDARAQAATLARLAPAVCPSEPGKV